MEPLPLEPPPAPAPAAPQYPAENGTANQYPEESAVPLTRMFPLDSVADKMFPNENGASAASRHYHSDDSAVRRMYQRESGALRRMYHSLSDYGMYPAYLSGLGLSTIAPSEPGEAARPPAHLPGLPPISPAAAWTHPLPLLSPNPSGVCCPNHTLAMQASPAMLQSRPTSCPLPNHYTCIKPGWK